MLIGEFAKQRFVGQQITSIELLSMDFSVAGCILCLIVYLPMYNFIRYWVIIIISKISDNKSSLYWRLIGWIAVDLVIEINKKIKLSQTFI